MKPFFLVLVLFLAVPAIGQAIEASGFKPVEIPSLTIAVTETAELARNLEVGAQAQTVTVESDVVAVQTENSTLGTVVNSQT